MLSAAFMSPRYIMIESPVPFIELFSPNKTPTAGRSVGIAALGCDNLLLCSTVLLASSSASSQPQKLALFIQNPDPTPISSYFKSSYFGTGQYSWAHERTHGVQTAINEYLQLIAAAAYKGDTFKLFVRAEQQKKAVTCQLLDKMHCKTIFIFPGTGKTAFYRCELFPNFKTVS